MRKIVLILAMLVAASAIATDKTTRKRLRRAEPMVESVVADTSRMVVVDSARVSFKGYDKPLRSSRETFFAVNVDTISVEGLYLTITYSDMQGRMLHRRSCSVEVSIPAGETRSVSLPTWDGQRAFYYYLSPRPQRASATAYKITMHLDSVKVQASE